ncbi:glycosyltransferase family 4 protein [Vogesella indigofera]|uniref:glycosyltransferase family 4 protein n=1 Tax=Vogesella indigofera TaxID=45465 RepID=UPI00234F6071|nr:glycosyltransferase family 4 protein [Vogesella indigofera]MDC7710847.1 glycosyltransferase family 4 protein [Vogesella indigofera]
MKLRSRDSIFVINSLERDLSQRHVSFKKMNMPECANFRVRGVLCVDGEYTPKSAIFSVVFFEKKGGRLSVGDYEVGFGYSQGYGHYKYLAASSEGVPFDIILPMPEGAFGFGLKITPKHGVIPYLRPGASLESIALKHKNELFQVLSALEGNSNLGNENFSLTELEKIINSHLGKASRIVILNNCFSHFKEVAPQLAAGFGWLLWRETRDSDLQVAVKEMLVFQGRMRDLYSFLKEVDEKALIRPKRPSYRRVADEIDKLDNGFPYPSFLPVPAYTPQRQSLYLLHNCLPYNSGGYATRTHGLLTGVVANSGFRVHGVSRPGYPTDHKKHISQPLPSAIPMGDEIDGISYFRCNQTIRKSSLTITEYINAYVGEVESLAREHRTAIIHAASNFPNGLAANVAARRLGVKSIYEVRGLWEITRMSRQIGWEKTEQFAYMAKMEAEACKGADAVITLTGALKNLMIERGVPEDKIIIVPNCVHTERFAPLERDAKLAKELGVRQDEVVVGYIGSVVNYEGLDHLLRALDILRKRGIDNFRFLLVGDGAVLHELKELAIELGLENKLIAPGRVPHETVQSYYSLVDITPFPRKPYMVCEMVSPLKPFEAMASAKAVVVSSCAALTEIVKDEVTGLVFEKGNFSDLANKLERLILDAELRHRLGEAGRQWVRAERDWKNAGKIVGELYSRLMSDFVSTEDFNKA